MEFNESSLQPTLNVHFDVMVTFRSYSSMVAGEF